MSDLPRDVRKSTRKRPRPSSLARFRSHLWVSLPWILQQCGQLASADTKTPTTLLLSAAAGGKVECGGRGMLYSNGTCGCMSGFRGPNCLERVCPAGLAWADTPSGKNTAHSMAECSNMGSCNRATGMCACSGGFEGMACERLSCPVTPNSHLVCSGHGRCMTLSQAAALWDGRAMRRPNVAYEDVWDAHKIQGCVCDYGFSGFDCSQRDCPRGDDPLTTGQQNEFGRIACLADEGAFRFTFRGHTTAPIPVNATAEYLEVLLEALPTLNDVSVSYDHGNSVCGVPEVLTTIEYLQDFGDLPPAKVTSEDLYVTGAYSSAYVYMETLGVFVCPVCLSCSGGIFVEFDREISDFIAHDADAYEVRSILEGISTLNDSVFGEVLSINVSMAGGDTLCSDTASVNTTIAIRSEYGNFPNLTVIASVKDSGVLADFDYQSPKGTKENAICSNHGSCNFLTGQCTCARNITEYPDQWYYYGSSDGYGNEGSRGDCGYRRTPVPVNGSCPYGTVAGGRGTDTGDTYTALCSGQGFCVTNTTVYNYTAAEGACLCFPGFFGGACEQMSCPTGKAWFDEAYADDAAHADGAECSNMGLCDHSTGVCACRPGWTGAACQRLDCPASCSGHGVCLPMWRLAEEKQSNGASSPVSYGIDDHSWPYGPRSYEIPRAWDFDAIHGCLCDGGTSGGRSVKRRTSATYYSGKWADPQFLPGWTGYSCAERQCPTGDDPLTTGGELEVQAVTCLLSSGSFTLAFRGQTTASLAYDATTDEVVTALQNLTTIGTVSVNFTTGAACDSSYSSGQGIEVTFYTELGDLPLLSASPSMTVTELVAGTKENSACAGRGYCDPVAGLCRCFDNYVSSDGDGSLGSRGDCGVRSSVFPFNGGPPPTTSS